MLRKDTELNWFQAAIKWVFGKISAGFDWVLIKIGTGLEQYEKHPAQFIGTLVAAGILLSLALP